MINACPDAARSLGGYRLGRVLGRGAMGVVYKGIAQASGLEVAVKTLRPDLLSSTERGSVLERFLHEADISRNLDHENIVRVLDSGQDGGDVFMAMELVLGRELKDALDSSTPIPMDRIEALATKLLAALAYSHGKGVIHRDIKPANILLVDSGGVKVMDFGIARVESSEMTRDGAMLGTPAYMSPEQVIGEKVDRRTDIYSAGVVLYQLLTGKKPFQGSLTQIMQQVLSATPPAPSVANIRISRAFDPIIARAMAKEREGRFENAREFSMALADAFVAAREEEASGDATIFVDMDATVLDNGAMAGDAPGREKSLGPEKISELGSHIRNKLQQGLDQEFSNSEAGRIREALREYVASANSTAGGSMPPADPRLAAVVARDVAVFVDTVLPKLKALIISNAPLPGKVGKPDDRMDWMGCIDVFAALSEGLDGLGRPGVGAAMGMGARAELLGAAMMYAGQINTLLFSPDHLELNRIAADFMRLDLLEWGLELLGGQTEMLQIANQVQMFSGQVLKRVASAIREFISSGDALARFDVASLLYHVEELIVIAERTLECDDNSSYQKILGRDIVAEFIESAEKLVTVSMEELLSQVSTPTDSATAFAGKLKQLAGLFLFSTRLDDEACQPRLQALSNAIHDGAESLASAVETALAEAQGEDIPMRQAQLTALWDIAESLGWAGLCERLLKHVRDGVLAGRG